MNTDEILQKNVQDALKWEPQLQAAEIGVIAKNGIVTLTGTVDNHYKKNKVENAIKKVSGVKAIVEKIEIKPADSKDITDNIIAERILNAFKSDFSIPHEKIKLKVEKGWVTLEGNVNWKYKIYSDLDSLNKALQMQRTSELFSPEGFIEDIAG